MSEEPASPQEVTRGLTEEELKLVPFDFVRPVYSSSSRSSIHLASSVCLLLRCGQCRCVYQMPVSGADHVDATSAIIPNVRYQWDGKQRVSVSHHVARNRPTTSLIGPDR